MFPQRDRLRRSLGDLMRKLFLTTAISLGLLASIPAHARAADATKEKDKDAPATKPAEGGVIEATDIQKLKDADGKDVTVHGKIAGTYKGKSRSEERRVGKECRSRWWTEH